MSRYPRTVYALKQIDTGRVYIGSSNDVAERIREHKRLLRRHSHPVEDLQSDYDLYGDNFDVEELDVEENDKQWRKEYEWMARYRSYERGKGYNYKDHHASTAAELVKTVDFNDFIVLWCRLWKYLIDLFNSDPEKGKAECERITKLFQNRHFNE